MMAGGFNATPQRKASFYSGIMQLSVPPSQGCIIELKRSSPVLFKSDHGHWIVSSDVNDAVNQAAHYMSEIEKTQTYIFQRYGVDVYRLKAKVLIGTVAPNDNYVEQKRQALRMYNSHLNRIEVITYDQLATISQNVIDANIGESGQETSEGKGEDVIPF